MNKIQKLISDLVNTSGAYSGILRLKPSLRDAAIIYVKMGDSNKKFENSYKIEFDGLDISTMKNIRFNKRLKNLSKKVDDLEEELSNKLPVFEMEDDSKKDMPLDKIYGTYKPPGEDNHPEVLMTFIHSLNRYFGYSPENELSIINFPESSAKALHTSLIELGKISIKLRVMNEVEDEIDLNGVYNFYLNFESVPAACEYFTNELGESVTRELLKEKIKEVARVHDEGLLIEDWSIINKRINSWVSYEGEKYNKEPIPIR